MVTIHQIEKLGRRIGREFNADRVVLFGSYAHGSATDDSDVDLLVILPFEGKSVDQSVQIRLRLRPAFPVDLLVRTPEKVRERLEMGDDFMREAFENGKVFYEADRRGMGIQGRRGLRHPGTPVPGAEEPQLRRRLLPRPVMRREVSQGAPLRSGHYFPQDA